MFNKTREGINYIPNRKVVNYKIAMKRVICKMLDYPFSVSSVIMNYNQYSIISSKQLTPLISNLQILMSMFLMRNETIK